LGKDKKKGNKYIKQRVASVGNFIVINWGILAAIKFKIL
jgi:hypothetical protein